MLYGPWDKGYKTFYRGNLAPSHGKTVFLCFKVILHWKLPWNGSKPLQYFNPRKSNYTINAVIYPSIVLIYRLQDTMAGPYDEAGILPLSHQHRHSKFTFCMFKKMMDL